MDGRSGREYMDEKQRMANGQRNRWKASQELWEERGDGDSRNNNCYGCDCYEVSAATERVDGNSRRSLNVEHNKAASRGSRQVSFAAHDVETQDCKHETKSKVIPIEDAFGVNKTAVSFSTIPILCPHLDDSFEGSELLAKKVFKPSSEHQPTPARASFDFTAQDNTVEHTYTRQSTHNFNLSSSTSTSYEAKPNPLIGAAPSMSVTREWALSSTPASAVNRDSEHDKTHIIQRRAIDFSRAEELASSTPPQQTDQPPKEQEYAMNTSPPKLPSMRVKRSVTGLEGANRMNLSVQNHPTHSFAYHFHEQPLNRTCDPTDAVYRTPFKEHIVTQSPEVRRMAASVVNGFVQRHIDSSPQLFNGSDVSIHSRSSHSSTLAPSALVGGGALYRSSDHHDEWSRKYRNESATTRELIEGVIKGLDLTESRVSSKNSSTKSTVNTSANDSEGVDNPIPHGFYGRSTIRDRVPRGQTRRLASMYETMNEEAINEVVYEHPSLVRTKSTPPQKGIHHTSSHHVPSARLVKGSLDDSFIVQRTDGCEVREYVNERSYFGGAHRSTNTQPVARDRSADSITSFKDRLDMRPSSRLLYDRWNESVSKRDAIVLLKPERRNAMPPPISPKPSSSSYVRTHRSVADTQSNNVNHSSSRDRSMTGWTAAQMNYRRDDGTVREGGNQKAVPLRVSNVAHHFEATAQVHKDPIDSHRFGGGRYVAPQPQMMYGGCGTGQFVSSAMASSNNNSTRPNRADVHSGTLSSIKSESIREKRINPTRGASYAYRTDSEAMAHAEKLCETDDGIAEVTKAFAFVDKEDSMVEGTDARYSRGAAVARSASKPTGGRPLGHSVSLYRNMGREQHAPKSDNLPFARYSPPAFGVSYGQRRIDEHPLQSSMNETLNKRESRNPLATSTPLEGSPASAMLSTRNSPARMLDSSGISTITYSTSLGGSVADRDCAQRLKYLSNGLLVQEQRLAQAYSALAHAKKFPNLKGTLAQLCAFRESLLCHERHSALQSELERMKALGVASKRAPELGGRMRGSLDVTAITVYLNRNFCIRNIDEGNSYAFVALLKASEQVFATEAVTLMDTRVMRVSSVKFNEHIRITNLPPDMHVTLHIYALKMTEAHAKGIEERSCAKLRNKAKSFLSPLRKPTLVNESVVSCSQFTRCGSVELSSATTGNQRLYLQNAEYPLEGTVEIRSACTALPPIIESADYQAFLTMYEVVSGLGSWARYWAVLRRGMIYFWKYPDEEAAEKPALAYVDLLKCTDDRIRVASFDVCSRPHAFSVDLVLSATPSVTEKKRVLLSADTKEQCTAWIDAVNGTLDIIRSAD